MSELCIRNLHASVKDGKEILKGLSLSVRSGEKHAIMGPNGGGKSTLASVIMGHPGYIVTRGAVLLDGEDITKLAPNERAKLGVFLGFQHPIEVAGVNFANFLRLSVNQVSSEKISPAAFRKRFSLQAEALGISEGLAKRSLNEGFSGGEKKKAEMLQLAMLKPKFAILDEPDSGLDVDALRSIAKSISETDSQRGLLMITHYQRILTYVKPDFVHIVKDGQIIKSGDAGLALEIEKSGYGGLTQSQ